MKNHTKTKRKLKNYAMIVQIQGKTRMKEIVIFSLSCELIGGIVYVHR